MWIARGHHEITVTDAPSPKPGIRESKACTRQSHWQRSLALFGSVSSSLSPDTELQSSYLLSGDPL